MSGGTGGGWRGSWLLLVMATLGSCGWHPLYTSASGGRSTTAAALARVDVPVIPERQGQLLRQALQARLGGAGGGFVPEFALRATYSVSSEGVAITPESAVTRVRLIASAAYSLVALQGGPRTCLAGSAHSVDAIDVENQQYFAADLETETAQRRLADAVADQIVTKIALAFGKAGSPCEAR